MWVGAVCKDGKLSGKGILVAHRGIAPARLLWAIAYWYFSHSKSATFVTEGRAALGEKGGDVSRRLTAMASAKGLARKAEGEGGQREGTRMLLLDQEKCKPNMPAHT